MLLAYHYHSPVLVKRRRRIVFCPCIIASTELGTTTLFAMAHHVTIIGDTRERFIVFKELYDADTSSTPSEVSCCPAAQHHVAFHHVLRLPNVIVI